MKLVKVIRAAEWWDYKLPPILAVAYLVFTATSPSVDKVIPLLLFVVLSLITGAAYVSIINDLTDIHDDNAAGKYNRMASYGKTGRIIIPVLVLSVAAVFCWYMRYHRTSLVLYISCYVAFTLYSVPPFRLKKRGAWGIAADAAGSQLLPTLYVAVITAAYLEYGLSGDKLFTIAAWSFCFGLRGILWHQFHDMENDIRSKVDTWAQKAGENAIKRTGYFIIIVEICALLWLLSGFSCYIGLAALGFYGLYLAVIRRKHDTEIILFRYTRPRYTIFMNEYYQVLLPAMVLVTLTVKDTRFAYLLVLHVLFFHMGFVRMFKNIFPGITLTTRINK